MSRHTPVTEEEVWQCFVCNNNFFVIDQSTILCPTCGNANPETLRLKEELEEEERENGHSPNATFGN